MTRKNYMQSLNGNETDMIMQMLDIVGSNLSHAEAEMVDGFPTGNVLVGMTSEDHARLEEITRHFGKRIHTLDFEKRNDDMPSPG